jgi:glycosyltransferase involved in cell wall biosynthesis
MLIGIDASRALRSRRTGTERYALEIIRHLLALPEAANHRWRLYVDQPTEALYFAQQPGIAAQPTLEICHLPAQRLWTHIALAREVVRRPPDLLFVPAHVLPFVLPRQRLPASVVTIHDLGYRYFPAAHTRFQRFYLEVSTRWSAWAATRLIAVSGATANDLTTFYQTPRHKIQVIYEAAGATQSSTNQENITTAQRIHLTRPYALYVGTIQPRKNLVRLIQAYQQLHQRQAIDWDLVLAGGQGWLDPPLSVQVADSDVAAHIHLLGYVAEDVLAGLYAQARFFCLPSLFEGFGLPVLEAQSYGVPVMTANNSALPEIAGDAAILVDPTDVEAIATAMLQLSQDEALRQRLITAGYANVKRFSWAKAARETLAVLEAALKRG